MSTKTKPRTHTAPEPTAARVVVVNLHPRLVLLHFVVHPPADATGRQRVETRGVTLKPGINLVDAAVWGRISDDAERARAAAKGTGLPPAGVAEVLASDKIKDLGEAQAFGAISDADARKYLDATGSEAQLKALKPFAGPHAKLIPVQAQVLKDIAEGKAAEQVVLLSYSLASGW